jgi:hypothetical protein
MQRSKRQIETAQIMVDGLGSPFLNTIMSSVRETGEQEMEGWTEESALGCESPMQAA